MWCKIFVIYIFLLIFGDLYVQANKTTSKDVKPAVDEKRVKEIAAIRKTLNEAFEKDEDMRTSGGKGVIVQPEWTQGDHKTKGSTKVVVTQKKLKDAAAIRNEIQNAVQSDTYAKGDSGFNVSEVDHYLGTKFRSKNVLSGMVGAVKENYDEEQVGDSFQMGIDDGLPNIVESSALEDDIDIEKLKRLEMSTRRTREVLILKEIVEDLSFKLGEDVKEWEHFEHDGQEYFIGLRDVDLVIIQKDDIKYNNNRVIDVGAPISYLESFSFWNVEARKQEGLILVAVDEKVLWFQANSNEVFWQWSVGTSINGLRYFKIGQTEYLAIASDRSYRTGYSSLNIYQFNVKLREFSIAQKLQLKDSCSEITFLDTGRDVVLAVVQNNSANIFTFNPQAEAGDHIKFKLKSTLQSEGIQSVAGFRMGGYSYLALGGLSPQILHYTNGEFVQKTIFGQNFGLVELFLPVPAQTYRDDLILLVQHRVDFDSHALVVLETLIWDGEAFEATSPAPCVIHNRTIAHGVGCMLDLQRDAGIKGSAILKRNNDIFIIVPRYKTESGLYQLKTELLAKNSELMDLREIFDYLKEWVKDQEDLTKEAYKFLEESSNEYGKEVDFSNLVRLKTPELDFHGNIGQIFINEYEWTEKDMEVDLEELIGAIERLDMELRQDHDIVRHRRELTYDTLDFDNVDADELVLQLLNGEQAYLKDSELIFDGDVSLESLKVLNEVRLSSARYARDDTMELNEDLEFKQINGVTWQDLITDVIFRNSPLEIGELQVNGDVIVEGDMKVHTLNNLEFPDNYLWSSGPTTSVVQAEKHFFGTLTVNAVDTGGLINGVNPFDIITLSENENIPGWTAFTHLEVTERMEVNGTVQGRGLTDFLSNPSLLESNIIHSACTFHHLEVRGPIFVTDKLNDHYLDAILSDVVYRPKTKGEKISIKARKTFNTVTFGSHLELKENLLSGIPIQSFVTKNTAQELDIGIIFGNVYFNTLTIKGQYDSVDLKELARNSVNIDEDRFVDLEVEFIDDISAQSIEILESLNGQRGFITLQDDVELEEASFNEVLAATVTSECDIIGNGTLELNTSIRPSSTVYVDELILESGLEVESLHDINATVLLSFLEKVDNIPAMILNGNILVDHIHLDGDVHVNKLNAHSFDEDIQMTAIWLNRPNVLPTNLEFEQQLIINGDLQINGFLNGIHFPMLSRDIVFKSENPVVITSPKRFLGNITVMENVNIESVNGLAFTDIATKQTMEQFRGTVYINGDLEVQNLEISGSLNNYSIGNLGESYRYDEELKSIVHSGEIVFKGLTTVENLYIDGRLNSAENLNEFLENIVYKNNICMLKGKTTFTGNVTIEKGAYIKNLNGYNIVQLMKNIVFINDPQPIVISAPVLFKDVVQAKIVTVKGYLNATNLMGCPLIDWMTDTLRVDEPSDVAGLTRFAPGALDGNSIYTVFLNDMDMEYVVTLHTPQNISGHVRFSDVHLVDSISTVGLVNGVDLQLEMENTLKISGNQHITTPLSMQSCNVIQCLETNNLINNAKDLRNLANLHENLDLYSPISFSKVKAKNLITNDLVSGIDFNQWHQNSLWTEGRSDMIVSGNWTVKELYVESPASDTMDQISRTLTSPYDDMQDQYVRLHEAYAGLCQRGKEVLHRAQNRIYFLRHFEKSFSLKEIGNISGVFSIVDAYQTYLVVNIECDSTIFLWDIESQAFKRINTFESGLITEIVGVPTNIDTLHLVTNVQSQDYGCSYLGVNSWQFDGEKVSHLRSFNDADISTIHHPLRSAGKFYAIDERSGKVLQLNPNSTEQNTWNFPPSESGSYRFLPHDADLGIALTNGQQVLLLNEPSRRRFRRKRDSLVSRQAQQQFEARSEIPVGKELSFADFRHVIDRILRDLIHRLNIQLADINITLSVGELQDEHLQTDFMDILEEIKKQKMLPSKAITDLHVELMEFSSNPVQILAARVVQVIWPVLGEVKEVHSHLRNNEHDHVICHEIFQLLSSAVHDILKIGNFSKKNPTDVGGTANMTEIFVRIQEFQKDILKTIDNVGETGSSETFTDTPPSSPEAPIQARFLHLNSTARNPLDEPFIGQAIPDRNLLAANSPHLPARGTGEIVSVKTGLSGNQRTLIAITEPKDHVIAGENDAIKIFFDVITGSLFQTLSAYKPTCLTACSFQDQSLLAFVEDKHLVRVMIYKGIQGFVEFVKFHRHEELFGLNFITLPAKQEYDCPRKFLMVSTSSKIDFYEIITAGHCGVDGKLQCNVWEGY